MSTVSDGERKEPITVARVCKVVATTIVKAGLWVWAGGLVGLTALWVGRVLLSTPDEVGVSPSLVLVGVACASTVVSISLIAASEGVLRLLGTSSWRSFWLGLGILGAIWVMTAGFVGFPYVAKTTDALIQSTGIDGWSWFVSLFLVSCVFVPIGTAGWLTYEHGRAEIRREER